MTQDELDQLPEVTGAVFQGPDDGMVTDVYGEDWMIGTRDGLRVKRRMRVLPRPSASASAGQK